MASATVLYELLPAVWCTTAPTRVPATSGVQTCGAAPQAARGMTGGGGTAEDNAPTAGMTTPVPSTPPPSVVVRRAAVWITGDPVDVAVPTMVSPAGIWSDPMSVRSMSAGPPD